MNRSALAKDHRILVIPGGGATGIVSARLLEIIEEQRNLPTHKLFTEIWASSIGAMIATLLTTPQNAEQPMKAREVVAFLEDAFSNAFKAPLIWSKFKKQAGEARMQNTLIPVKILCAEVTQWKWKLMPSDTRLFKLCQKEHAEIPIASAACASSSLYPLKRTEKISTNGRTMYCVDAGMEYCDGGTMDPTEICLSDFNQEVDFEQDTVSLYFLSNGWVKKKCDNPLELQKSGDPLKKLTVNIFNLDVQLQDVLDNSFPTNKISVPYIQYNLAGAGFVSLENLKKQADEAATTEDFSILLMSLPELTYQSS